MSKIRKVTYYIGIGMTISGLVFYVLYRLTRHNFMDENNHSLIYFAISTIMILTGYTLIKICERGVNDSKLVLDTVKIRCRDCGSLNDEGTIFCKDCGKEV